MGRNADVTAVSNNSWGAVDGPEASPSSALWQLAVKNGVTRGYDGKGVFYVWAAGNGHQTGEPTPTSTASLTSTPSPPPAPSPGEASGAATPRWAPASGSVPLVVILSGGRSPHCHRRKLRPLRVHLQRHLRRDPYRLRRRRPRTRGQPGPHLARREAHPRRNCPQERSHKPRLGGRRAHVRPRLRCRPLPLQPRVRLRCR